MRRLAALLATAAIALPAAADAPEVEGEVTKVDKAQARVTLRHGEIRHLDMPAMTMVFRVADPAMLEALGPGTRVRFVAEKVDGRYTVTRIVPAR